MGIFDKIFRKKHCEKDIHSESIKKVQFTNLRLNNKTINQLTEFIAIDIETTGLNPHIDKIIEISLIKFTEGNVTKEISTFIHPEIPIPAQATEVNNITNQHVLNAPSEQEALKIVQEFLDPILNGKIICCAHKANFEIQFLKKSLERNHYSGNIKIIDTLTESRNLIQNVKNHKLTTLASHLDIKYKNPHRAYYDALVCGKLLLKEIDLFNNKDNNLPKKKSNNKLISDEIEVCAFLYKIISDKELPLDLIKFYKNSSGYVRMSSAYTNIQFKIGKNYRYFILPVRNNSTNRLPTNKSTMSEGGAFYERIYFNSIDDLTFIKEQLIEEYALGLAKYEDLKYNHKVEFNNNPETNSNLIKLNAEKVNNILQNVKMRKSINQLKHNITKQKEHDPTKIKINPDNNRVDIKNVSNKNNLENGFNIGFPIYKKGESFRKQGNISEALAQFDKARNSGYFFPALYLSYSMAYRKIKDYENEIDIINEAIEILELDNNKLSYFIARRDKAITLLLKQK